MKTCRTPGSPVSHRICTSILARYPWMEGDVERARALILVVLLAVTGCAASHVIGTDAGHGRVDSGVLPTLGEPCVETLCLPHGGSGCGCAAPYYCQVWTSGCTGVGCAPEGDTCYGPFCPTMMDSECPSGFICVGTDPRVSRCALSCTVTVRHDSCPAPFRCGHTQDDYAEHRLVCAGDEWLPWR